MSRPLAAADDRGAAGRGQALFPRRERKDAAALDCRGRLFEPRQMRYGHWRGVIRPEIRATGPEEEP